MYIISKPFQFFTSVYMVFIFYFLYHLIKRAKLFALWSHVGVSFKRWVDTSENKKNTTAAAAECVFSPLPKTRTDIVYIFIYTCIEGIIYIYTCTTSYTLPPRAANMFLSHGHSFADASVCGIQKTLHQTKPRKTYNSRDMILLYLYIHIGTICYVRTAEGGGAFRRPIIFFFVVFISFQLAVRC